ncbi:MAG: TolC family protein [Acidiferrobacteraceae bacterium]
MPISNRHSLFVLRRGFLVLLGLGLLSGCAHFTARPISPEGSLAQYDRRALSSPGLATFLKANNVSVPAPDGPWSLKALTLTALYYQPSLAEARARLLAAQAAQITARERRNPSLSLAPAYDSGVPSAPSPWIVPISIRWPIATAGRRRDRIAGARHLALAARWNLVKTVWDVRSTLRTALLDLYAARRTEALLGRQEQALRTTLTLLQGQVRAGALSNIEVTRARVELDHTVLAREAEAGRVRQARIELAKGLGVPLRALADIKLSNRPFRMFPEKLTQPQVRQQALLGRADVRAALERYAATQSALQLQIARQWPRLNLGPGFAWNAQLAGDREWTLGLGLTLPILNRNQGPIAEARAQRRLAAARFLAVQSAAIAEIDGALAAYRTALLRVKTAVSLQRSLRAQFRAIDARVLAGEDQPLDLSEAKIALIAGDRDLLATRIEAQRALGRLENGVESSLTFKPLALHDAGDPSLLPCQATRTCG